jgi:hypothetical protein
MTEEQEFAARSQLKWRRDGDAWGRFGNSDQHGANGNHSMSACDVRLRIKER